MYRITYRFSSSKRFTQRETFFLDLTRFLKSKEIYVHWNQSNQGTKKCFVNKTIV